MAKRTRTAATQQRQASKIGAVAAWETRSEAWSEMRAEMAQADTQPVRAVTVGANAVAEATRARALDAAAWVARAVQLAKDAHTSWDIMYHGRNEAGEYVYSCPSTSQPARFYSQIINPERFTIWCGCDGHKWGNPCKHAGAAIILFRHMTYPCLIPEQKTLQRETLGVEVDQVIRRPGVEYMAPGECIRDVNLRTWREAAGW